MFAGFPGISCLATLISSLRDKGWGPCLTLTLTCGRGTAAVRGVDFVGLVCLALVAP